MSVETARAALVAAADFGEGAVKEFARRVLELLDEGGDDPPDEGVEDRRKRLAKQRQQRYRDRHGVTPRASRGDAESVTRDAASVTNCVTRNAPRARDLNLDLYLSPEIQDSNGSLLLGGPEGNVTRHALRDGVTLASRVTRKKPVTHCPGPEESPEAVDDWCRSHGIPPASQVRLVDEMLGWHQKKGIPRASWLRTWQDWQRNEPRFAAERKSGSRPVAPVYDPEEERRAARARNRAADAKVEQAAREAQATDADRARAADDDQARRARTATRRAPGEPVSLAGARAPRVELTTEQREAERQRQLQALDEMKRKAGGT